VFANQKSGGGFSDAVLVGKHRPTRASRGGDEEASVPAAVWLANTVPPGQAGW
jgi:hypothetical protein